MSLNRRFHEQAGEQGDEGQSAAPSAADAAARAALDGQQPQGEAGAGTGTGTEGSPALGDASGAGSKEVAPTWPDDWRVKLAAGNEKELKQLERYTTPNDIWKKARALETRVSSGELKAVTPFPTDGTPEQQNAWRAENGVPVAPDKYEIDLGEGVVLGEADKPLVDDFLTAMHEKNLPTSVANDVLGWYMKLGEKVAENQAAADNSAKTDFEDVMRAEWGTDYRPNINAVHALLDMAPEGVKDRFMNGRAADGRPFGSDPDTMRWLARVSREINPITTIVPGAGANIGQAIEDEIATIETAMRNKSSEYFKGPTKTVDGVTDTVMSHRYRQLLTAREKHQGRG